MMLFNDKSIYIIMCKMPNICPMLSQRAIFPGIHSQQQPPPIIHAVEWIYRLICLHFVYKLICDTFFSLQQQRAAAWGPIQSLVILTRVPHTCAFVSICTPSILFRRKRQFFFSFTLLVLLANLMNKWQQQKVE